MKLELLRNLDEMDMFKAVDQDYWNHKGEISVTRTQTIRDDERGGLF